VRKNVAEKTAQPFTEVQLGFSFLSDTEASSSAASADTTPQTRASRGGSKPRGLAETLATARTVLLEAPLTDVGAQLLPLLEFCEAALTRALDVVPTRPEASFSAEEYRSLRGIGQAQWLLAEKQNRYEKKQAPNRGKKVKKKMMNNERSEKTADS
jgi:hypothetical protein